MNTLEVLIRDTAIRMTQARSKMLVENPFFGQLAMKLEPTPKPGYKTMGTDGSHIFYDPEFVDELTDDDVEFIVAHEVLHCVFKHVGWPGARRMLDRNPRLWNYANDYVINGILIEAGLKMPEGKHQGLHNPKYQTWTSEQVYEDLLNNPPPKCNGNHAEEGDQQSGDMCDGSCQHNQPGGKGQPGNGGGKLLDDHSMHSQNGSPLEGGDNAMKKREWDGYVQSAHTKAKLAGKLPSGIGELVSVIFKPKIDLEPFLHTRMQGMTTHDFRWFPPNRRHVGNDLYLPSSYGRHLEIAVALDSSGSVSSRELSYFLGVMQRVMDTYASYKITVIPFSAYVHKPKIYIPGTDLRSFEFEDRGGTAFLPVFDWIKKNLDEARLDALIFLSDGFPCDGYPVKRTPYDTIWVFSHASAEKPPFGSRINLDVA